MRDLNYGLRQLCLRNQDGSYQTQADRRNMLYLMADQLHELGFRRLTPQSLKPKHVDALLTRWREQDIAIGTVKNRLSVLRWWAEKVDKQNVMHRSNDRYGIADRQFVARQSKATTVSNDALAAVKDEHVRMSLELQQAFGLRREEAIKFSPRYADLGDRIRLKPSWTKGSRPREVRIRNDRQRVVLDRAHRLAGRGSLIPSNRSYIQQLRIYERHTATAGLSKLHGLRHHYAQERYRELTGWPAPAVGGPQKSSLTDVQRELGKAARMAISNELGHTRAQITVVYLG